MTCKALNPRINNSMQLGSKIEIEIKKTIVTKIGPKTDAPPYIYCNKLKLDLSDYEIHLLRWDVDRHLKREVMCLQKFYTENPAICDELLGEFYMDLHHTKSEETRNTFKDSQFHVLHSILRFMLTEYPTNGWKHSLINDIIQVGIADEQRDISYHRMQIANAQEEIKKLTNFKKTLHRKKSIDDIAGLASIIQSKSNSIKSRRSTLSTVGTFKTKSYLTEVMKPSKRSRSRSKRGRGRPRKLSGKPTERPDVADRRLNKEAGERVEKERAKIEATTELKIARLFGEGKEFK